MTTGSRPRRSFVEFRLLSYNLCVSPLGGGERPIVAVDFPVHRGQIGRTPDSREIVYRGPSPEGYAIYAVHVDTGEQRQLTSADFPAETGYYLGDDHPTFSPDGSRLAFVRRHEVRVDEIWAQPSAGGEETPLEARSTNIAKMYWTPDSRELFYVSLGRVFRTSVEDGNVERLRGLGRYVQEISIARSAPRIVWSESETDRDVWSLELDEHADPVGPPRPVASTTRDEHSPEISPDGSRLTFISDRSGTPELWLAESDGGSPVQLTSFGEDGGALGVPIWSPDGERISFDGHLGDIPGQDIWVVDASGAPPRNLTNTPDVYEARPAFSHDGRWIYYRVSAPPGPSSIWRVPSEGGEGQLVLDEPAVGLLLSPDGQYLTSPIEGGLGELQ